MPAPGSPAQRGRGRRCVLRCRRFARHTRQRRRDGAGDEPARHETERRGRDAELERPGEPRRFRGLRPRRRRPVPSEQRNAADEQAEGRLHVESLGQRDSRAILRDDHERDDRAHQRDLNAALAQPGELRREARVPRRR